MAKNLFTDQEVVLCTYIARFGRGFFNEKRVSRLEKRSEDSVKMKVQNIAAMLNEEGYDSSDEVAKLGGLPRGQDGRKTNWHLVSALAELSKQEFKERCRPILRAAIH